MSKCSKLKCSRSWVVSVQSVLHLDTISITMYCIWELKTCFQSPSLEKYFRKLGTRDKETQIAPLLCYFSGLRTHTCRLYSLTIEYTRNHSLIVKNNLLGVVKNKNNFLDEEDNAGTDWCTCVIVLLRLNRLTDQGYGSLINWEVSSVMR